MAVFMAHVGALPPVAKPPLSRTLIATENGRFYGSRTDARPLSPGNVVPLQQNIHCHTTSAECFAEVVRRRLATGGGCPYVSHKNGPFLLRLGSEKVAIWRRRRGTPKWAV